MRQPTAASIDPRVYEFLKQVTEPTLAEALANTRDEYLELAAKVPPERGAHRYAPGKWSILQVLQHIVDCERVFVYRALRFARGDAIELPGFDENEWAAASNACARTVAAVVAEFDAVRAATRAFFEADPPDRSGVANGRRMTVAGYGYLAGAHCRHHLRVVRERYLDG